LIALGGTHLLNAQPLSGTYSIGASGTYSTFTQAVNDLKANGVNGPVLFQVAPGTYPERLTITSIVGASSTNTIRFSGAGKTATILSNTGTNPGDWATIHLDGADHITFHNMGIEALGSSYGIGVLLTGQADSN